MTDISEKDSCLMLLAWSNNNNSMCRDIQDRRKSHECVNSGWSNPCYYLKLVDNDEQDKCYAARAFFYEDIGKCGFILDPISAQICILDFTEMAIAKDDIDLCGDEENCIKDYAIRKDDIAFCKDDLDCKKSIPSFFEDYCSETDEDVLCIIYFAMKSPDQNSCEDALASFPDSEEIDINILADICNYAKNDFDTCNVFKSDFYSDLCKAVSTDNCDNFINKGLCKYIITGKKEYCREETDIENFMSCIGFFPETLKR